MAHKPLALNKPGGGKPRWSREIARQQTDLFDQCTEIGILMVDGIMVLDFDTKEIYEEWYKDNTTLFDSSPVVKTKHGFHVYLRRSAYCDTKGFTDGPVGRVYNEETMKIVKRPMDVKTYTSSTSPILNHDGTISNYTTPGFVSTPPTKGKTWIRSLFEVQPKEIPDAIVDRIISERIAFPGVPCSERAPQCAPGAAAETASPLALFASLLDNSDIGPPLEDDAPLQPRATLVAAPRQLDAIWVPRFENDKPCLLAMGFTTFDTLNTFCTVNTKSLERGYTGGGYQFQFRGRCPLCHKDDGHKSNMFYVMYRLNGERRILNYSLNCTPQASTKLLQSTAFNRVEPRRSAVLVPWSRPGRESWLDTLQDDAPRLSDAILSKVKELCPDATDTTYGWRDSRFLYLVDDNLDTLLISTLVSQSSFGACSLAETFQPWVSSTLALKAAPFSLPVLLDALH